METYSRTGNNYSVDTYKEFVLLSRSGLSKNEIFRRLKEKNPKLTIVHIDNWFARFTPDLLPSETQLKYQKIYNDFRRNGKNRVMYVKQKNISGNTLTQAVNFCEPKAIPWLEEFEKENGIVRQPISMIAEPLQNNTSIEMIDSLGPDLPTQLNSSNRLNTSGATPTSGRSHKAELCLGELKITWESTDIERSLCKIIMNLTGEFSL
jgi:hypothetical protein